MGPLQGIVGGKLPMEVPSFMILNPGRTIVYRNFRSKAGALYLAILSCTTKDDRDETKRCAIIVQQIQRGPS